MTDHHDPLDDVSADEYNQLAALLSRTDVWDEPEAGLEDQVVDAILAEADAARPASADIGSLAERRMLRSKRAPRWWLGAAAAVALIVAGAVIFGRGGNDAGGVTFALTGTDAAPNATAEATVAATPAGLKILLDADGLPGAPEGFMYEAWVSDGEIGISAGTFHLRGGSGTIELWAGVADAEFHRLAVTLEPIDGDATSSRDARLVGTFSLDD